MLRHYTKFQDRTRADIDNVLLELTLSKGVLGPTRFQKLETDRGINYVPEGILWDASLKSIYNPMEHIIVDWQHTFCSDGVCNTCIWTTMHFLRQRGFTNQGVRDFMRSVHMPYKYGKVDPDWLHDNRLRGTKFSSFSNVVLHLMPILFVYLEHHCMGGVAPVIRYFNLMYTIIGCLASGPEEAPHHCDTIRTMIRTWHKRHVQLSEDLKPKIHQMHHVPDGMIWLGKLLSCFVCERKHRDVKDAALHVFRHIEHTVIHDVVNKQCEQLQKRGVDLFQATVLVDPRVISGAPFLISRSTKAIAPMGALHSNDVIWMQDGRCCRIKMFYEVHGDFLLNVDIFDNVGDDPAAFDERHSTDAFVGVAEVVDACTWFYIRPSIIKVAVPPIAVLKAS